MKKTRSAGLRQWMLMAEGLLLADHGFIQPNINFSVREAGGAANLAPGSSLV